MIPSILINLLSSFIAFLVGLAWVRFIFPFIQNLTYKGIRIDGKWKVYVASVTALNYELSVKRETILTISQNAYKISGSAQSTATLENGNQDIIDYSVEGKINDRFVMFTLLNKDQSRIAYSIFLMEVNGYGDSMTGFRAFYALIGKEINAIKCELKKIR